MAKMKKNYYMSEESIQRVKQLAEENDLSEGKMLEKLLRFYEGTDETLMIISAVQSEIRLQKKVLETISDATEVMIKMLNSMAAMQNIYAVVDPSQLLMDAREEMRREKNERIVRAMNRQKKFL